jgi:hypothetical protein
MVGGHLVARGSARSGRFGAIGAPFADSVAPVAASETCCSGVAGGIAHPWRSAPRTLLIPSESHHVSDWYSQQFGKAAPASNVPSSVKDSQGGCRELSTCSILCSRFPGIRLREV